MKKLLAPIIMLLAFTSLNAQNIACINTENILKEIPQYVSAQEELTVLSDKYKAIIEKEVGEIETLYNDYQQKKAAYSQAQRTAAENEIISREKSVQEKQKIYFGESGIMAKKSDELLLPIKKKVDSAISMAAKAGGYAMVLDLSAMPGVVYSEGLTDISDIVIQIYNNF